MKELFTIDTQSFLRVVIAAPFLYAIMIFNIRIMGKRTTAQMNNFDWAVTVAMGSLIASPMTSNTSITIGALGIALLMLLQYILTKLSFYSDTLQKIVRATPTLLLYEGKMLYENLEKERVLPAEVQAAIRENGYNDLTQIYAVILESDAMFSVIAKEKALEHGEILSGLTGLPETLKNKFSKL